MTNHEYATEVKQRSLLQESWLRLKGNKAAIIGMVILIMLILISIATIVIDCI